MLKFNAIILVLSCAFANLHGQATRELQLSDFEGIWTVSGDSIGSVAGPRVVGIAETTDGVVTVDSQGKGIVTLGRTFYDGQEGTLTVSTPSHTIQITITDAKHGVGTLVSSIGGSRAFVVTRSIRTGKVTRLNGHVTTLNPETRGVVDYNWYKQYQ